MPQILGNLFASSVQNCGTHMKGGLRGSIYSLRRFEG